MTSTDFTTGFGENPKPSSKVLRPPGGGSTDIFGPEPTPQTPRSVKNHMASNIFGNHSEGQVKNSGDCGRRVQKNVDSYSRLFGEPDRPFTPAKNHMRSNIPIGQDAADGKKMMNGNGVLAAGLSVANCDSTMNANAVRKENARMENAARMENRNGNGNANGTNNAGEVHNGGNSKTEGNPITGEGYKPAGTEINTTIPCLNGANQVINKNRIPPGGFSSGLW